MNILDLQDKLENLGQSIYYTKMEIAGMIDCEEKADLIMELESLRIDYKQVATQVKLYHYNSIKK